MRNASFSLRQAKTERRTLPRADLVVAVDTEAGLFQGRKKEAIVNGAKVEREVEGAQVEVHMVIVCCLEILIF